MKTVEEIKRNPRIAVLHEDKDGIKGIIAMPTWKGSLIVTNSGGWEHASVSPEKLRTIPTWDDMCMLKNMIWNEDETVIEVHPPKAEYVNNLPNCLHLWRCYFKEMVLPPSFMVGLKKGQTMSDIEKEAKEYFEMVGEKF